MSSLPFAELAEPGGFRSDSRFVPAAPEDPLPPPAPEDPADPLTLAWDEGYLAGLTEARTQAEMAATETAAALDRVELSLGQLDAQMQEQLRSRLLATVTALCEASLVPLTLDQAALLRRVEKACAMLARADDDKVLRLHPEDLKLIANKLPQSLAVKEDNSLERGSLRIETASGGVEDGPATWRQAIAEALAQC